MDGTKRSHLRKGLRVAIVLKEDQPTGKRTIGTISAILTPSEEHHRGIKVRLTDGKVGRVQEILAPEPPRTRPAAPREPDALAVLLVRNGEGHWYSRRKQLDDGDAVLCLGLDRQFTQDNVRASSAAAEELARRVRPAGVPQPLGTASLTLDSRPLPLAFFVLEADHVDDPQAHHWDWTGWVSPTEIRDAHSRHLLSPDSELALPHLTSHHLI